jgi:hypothetical protein
VIGSRFNHSCQPNLTYRHTKDQNILFRARADIESGEELTSAYIDFTDNRTTRRQKLLRIWEFHCECTACIQDLDLANINRGGKFELDDSEMGMINSKALSQLGIPVVGEPSLRERAMLLAVRVWNWKMVPQLIVELGAIRYCAEKFVRQGGWRIPNTEVVWSSIWRRNFKVLAADNPFGLSEPIIRKTSSRIVDSYLREIIEECKKVEDIVQLEILAADLNDIKVVDGLTT